ncbi:MAG: ABC transporter ATP-binding protein [Clostridia bacterium]|nr:ABC transporter ATP-binding protein [Clostridia bacterium]
MGGGPGGGPNAGREEPKRSRASKKYLLLRMWGYLFKYRGLLFLSLGLALASTLLTLFCPRFSGRAIDAILAPGGVDFYGEKGVFHYCLLMLIFYVVSGLLSYALSLTMLHLSQKTVYQLRKDVFDRLSELPVSFFDNHQTGDILSRMQYDINTVNASLANDLRQIVTSSVTVVFSLVMMFSISRWMLIPFAVTIPATVIFTRYKTKKVRPLFRKRSAKLGELNGYAEEILSGQKTIKAYNREEVMTARFKERNEETAEAYYQADYYGSLIGPSVNFINNLNLCFISVFGAMLYLFGMISVGDISSFVVYSKKFSGPINEFANIMNELQSAFSAAERVFRLIDEPTEAADLPDAEVLTDPEGEVEMEHIHFGYLPEKTIIHDLSFKAEKGKLIAIVGHTGAGKTTLINLLMRFYDPQSGEIRVDGKNIGHLTRKSLRLAYTMVLQETWLFSGTIAENIAYSRADATREEIEEAAKAAMIHDYIMSLPDGYDTLINEDGLNISKGQKQLMTIARAMLARANMLILDEATSNVDTQTEMKIQAAMYKLMEGKTSFVIAHRLSTIKNADHILVVDAGDIVEQGTHRELLAKGGYYAKLYASQFE